MPAFPRTTVTGATLRATCRSTSCTRSLHPSGSLNAASMGTTTMCRLNAAMPLSPLGRPPSHPVSSSHGSTLQGCAADVRAALRGADPSLLSSYTAPSQRERRRQQAELVALWVTEHLP